MIIFLMHLTKITNHTSIRYNQVLIFVYLVSQIYLKILHCKLIIQNLECQFIIKSIAITVIILYYDLPGLN